MRFVLPALLLLPAAVLADSSAGAGGLYPQGLLPLTNRANILLSTGQFNEAAKLYSEAIDQSPTDYLLYYKRATTLHSLKRHAAKLGEYDKVLSLTSQTFNLAHFSKARIYLKEGDFPASRTSLARYIKAKGRDAIAIEQGKDLDVSEQAREQAERESRAELWSACVESSTRALGVASFSVDVRAWRVECSFASGDLEGSVDDLTRLTHLLPPSTVLLTHLFSLSYFLLPASPSSHSALKQCLHYDQDSKSCLVLHRLYTNPSSAPLCKSTSSKRKEPHDSFWIESYLPLVPDLSRKQAKFAHPDKGGLKDKMTAVHEAHEILTNPELCARFNAGDDPMDPSARLRGGRKEKGEGKRR
ncbi:hypothetical protein BDQ17DRAFT_1411193, partial [Cyathus striatus]